jgi:hypothetical protein
VRHCAAAAAAAMTGRVRRPRPVLLPGWRAADTFTFSAVPDRNHILHTSVGQLELAHVVGERHLRLQQCYL